jgi:chromate transporter
VSFFEILLIMFLSGFFSLGGGNGAVAVIQSQWIEPGILDPGLFAWAFALGHLVPGPKIGFTSGVGYYLLGLPGAIAAVLGIVASSCVSAAAGAFGLRRIGPLLHRLELPAGFVIAGMIAAAAWMTASPMKLTPPELLAVVMVTALVGRFRVEPAVVLVTGLLAGLAWSLLTL